MIVEWEEIALDELADLYVTANLADQDAIARCVERINVQLASAPWYLGESRGINQRVWFIHPLVVAFALPLGGGVVVFHVSRLKGSA